MLIYTIQLSFDNNVAYQITLKLFKSPEFWR